MSNQVSIERLREVFECDAEAGVLTWKTVVGMRLAVGSRAGCTTPLGYRLVGIDGRKYLEHRVIFAMTHGRWPKKYLDHINGNPADNRIANLREATAAQNNWNMRLHTRNKTGLKGICFVSKRGVYRAQIMTEQGRKFLGHFKSAEDAHAAYVRAAHETFGEFARAA